MLLRTHNLQHRALRLAVGTLLLVLPLLARASALDVDPIRIAFSGTDTIAVLTVTNDGDGPATVQLQPVAWSQAADKDVYTPTRDVLATPPIFTVQPHGKQVIRLGLRVHPDLRTERSYRLYLEEVPQPSTVRGLGVIMALRIGVPVFVQPVNAATAVLHWSAERTSDGSLRVSATNAGGGHIQVRRIAITEPKSGLSYTAEQSVYVLPGATRSWTLKPVKRPALAAVVHISADTDLGSVDGQAVLQ